MIEKTTVTLRAKGTGLSHSRADIAIRDLVFTIDEPTARGGTNAGPTPTDAALAALIGCTNVIGHKVAESRNVDIGELTISARCQFDRKGVTLSEEVATPFQEIELLVEASGGASDAELQAVAQDVAKYCPLYKLFKGAGTKVVEIWRRA